jgi:hypothetical protein
VRATCDHVIAWSIGRIVIHLDIRALAWQHDRVRRSLAELERDFVKEQHVTCTNSLDLAPQFRYTITQTRRH